MERYFKWFGLPGSLVLTALMSLLAVVMAVLFRTPDRWLRMVAMLLSSLGDIILMRYAPIVGRLPKPMRGFIGGGATFAAAHGFYIAAFVTRIMRDGYAIVNTGFWVGIAVTVVIVAFMSALFLRSGQKTFTMLAFCLVYALVIGAMMTFVFSYTASADGAAWIIAVGAVSFAISDSFIGLDVLGKRGTQTTQDLIWWFYPIGQILILIP